MGKIVKNFLILLLLVMPSTVFFAGQEDRAGNLAFAKEDTMEGEEDDTEATVETDAADEDTEDAVTADKDAPDESEEESETLKPSPDADVMVHFTKPSNPLELPAGKQVRLLVGFTNKGSVDFIVDSMEASFRYPQDFSFFLQNFTSISFNSVIEPRRQATFEYGFNPNEAFSSRPFGLSILLNYKDADGNVFQTAVFNETIQVTEPDDGLDGETFFLYIFLAAIIILLLVGAHQLFLSYGKKRLVKPRKKLEMGTQNSDIDYDWIPKEILQGLNQSPRRSPKSPKQNGKGGGKQNSKSSAKQQSPRQRRNLRSSGFGEE